MIPCPSTPRPKPGAKPPLAARVQGFTIVEVMMASVILVVGFMGMITAITIGSEMLATARRQTIASQLITHEIDQIRLKQWSTVNTLPTTTTWSAGTGYSVGTVIQYRGGRYRCTQAHTASATDLPPVSPNYWTAHMTFDAATTYLSGDIVSSGGAWYRYINSSSSSGNTPPNTTYWKSYEGPNPTGVADGVTFALTRNISDLTTDIREVSFVVSWTKSGTSTAATTPTGSWIDKLAFYRPSSISRTYTRSMTTMVGKYGLNLGYQR